MDNNYTNIYGKQERKGVKTELDLSKVEIVKTANQEYIKYINPETNEVTLMENNSKDPLQIHLEKMRDYYAIKQGSNAQDNTNEILSLKQKYDSDTVSFIKIEEINSNQKDFDNQLSALKPEQMKVLKYLIIHRKELKIDKINLEKGIALDYDGNVIEASLNPETLEISAKNADTVKFEYKSQSSFSPSSNEESINKGSQYTDEQYMEYPELLEKEYNEGLINLEEKESIKKRIEQAKNEQASLTNTQQKQFVYTMKNEHNKAGFVDYVFYPFMIIVIGLLIIVSISIFVMI